MLACSIMSFSRCCYASTSMFFFLFFSAHTSLPHSLRRLVPHHTPLSNPVPYPPPIIPQHPSIPPPDFPFPHHQITSRLSSKTQSRLAVVGGVLVTYLLSGRGEGNGSGSASLMGRKGGWGLERRTQGKVSGILVGEVISSFGVVDGVSH